MDAVQIKCLRCGREVSATQCSDCGFDMLKDRFISIAQHLHVILPNGRENEDADQVTKTSFFMPIDEVFTVSGKGTVVCGKVFLGRVSITDQVEIILKSGKRLRANISKIEIFKRLVDIAWKGDPVGIFLPDIKKEDILGAQCLVNPGANIMHKSFSASLYLLTKEEGGTHEPVFDYYKPAVVFSTMETRGLISFDRMAPSFSNLTSTGEKPPIDVMLLPGNSVDVKIELDSPAALVQGMPFIIHQGSGVIRGRGTIIATED